MHALTGFFLGNLFDQPYAMLILIIASVFPDFDLIFIAKGKLSFWEHHRKLTHSLVGVPLFSAIFALFFPNYLSAFLLFLTGMYVHLIYDLTNHCGTEIFYPFKKRRYALEFTNSVELPLYGIYAVFFTLMIFYDEMAVSKLLFVFSGIYFVFKGMLHRVAINLASKKYGKCRAWPHFWNIFKWHTIHEENEMYFISEINLLRGSIKKVKMFEKAPDYLKEFDKNVKEFLDFAMYPAIETDKNTIKLRDLRFFATNHFMMVMKTDSMHHVMDEQFKN